MKKNYISPSALVLASQAPVGPNIGSGDDGAELQPETNQNDDNTTPAKWSGWIDEWRMPNNTLSGWWNSFLGSILLFFLFFLPAFVYAAWHVIWSTK